MAIKQFTLRLNSEVYDQISVRAQLLCRSVNKEIETLLAWAIDRQVEVDEETLQKMRDHLAGKGRETSKTAAELGLPARG